MSDIRKAFEEYAGPIGLLEGASYLPERDAYDWPTAQFAYHAYKAATQSVEGGEPVANLYVRENGRSVSYSLDGLSVLPLGKHSLYTASQPAQVPSDRYKLIPYNVGISADTCFLIVDTETGEKLYRGPSSFASVSRESGERIVSALNNQPLTAAPSGDASPVQQGKNRYGLDVDYFSRLIAREFGDLSNFTPDEFARVAARMANTACASVLQESEFSLDSGDAKREAAEEGLIFVGYTNGHQILYANENSTDASGAFYPDTENDCVIPLYLLRTHGHRVESTTGMAVTLDRIKGLQAARLRQSDSDGGE